MTPNERAAAFRERIITDPARVDEDFLQRVFEKGRRLHAKSQKQ